MTFAQASLYEIEDTIVTWIFTHYPTIATSITLIIVCCWLTWWVRGRFIDYRNEFRQLRSDSNQLDRNQQVFNRSLASLDKKLDHLIIYLQSTKMIDGNLFRSQSPLALTETGKKILVEMGGQKFIKDHLYQFVEQIKAQNFKSGLDVQNYCSVLLNERISDDDFVPVKDYIFKTPIYKLNEQVSIPLDLTVAIMIMAIYLRDRFFEKVNPELKIEI